MGVCELAGYAECRGDIEKHHIIARGKGAGASSAVKKALNHPRLIAYICRLHHRNYGRSPWARRLLIERRCKLWGREYMKGLIDSIPWKVPQPDLSFEGIVSYAEVQQLHR